MHNERALTQPSFVQQILNHNQKILCQTFFSMTLAAETVK